MEKGKHTGIFWAKDRLQIEKSSGGLQQWTGWFKHCNSKREKERGRFKWWFLSDMSAGDGIGHSCEILLMEKTLTNEFPVGFAWKVMESLCRIPTKDSPTSVVPKGRHKWNVN